MCFCIKTFANVGNKNQKNAQKIQKNLIYRYFFCYEEEKSYLCRTEFYD